MVKLKSLEDECLYFIFRHKYRTLLKRMIAYFETIDQNEVNLSGAYYKTPEQRARQAINDLIITNNIDKFNSLYEKAYLDLNS